MEKLILEEDKGIFKLANITFILLACLFCSGSIVLGFFDLSFKLSVLIVQYCMILIPLIVVLKIKGVSIKEKFLFKKVKIATVLKTILLTAVAIPSAYALNFIVSFTLLKLDVFVPATLDVSGEGLFHSLTIVFLVSLTPGFVEEFFFRGMMLSGYREKLSPKTTMLLTAVLFAIFHFTIQNFMLPFFLGIILAWLVYTTGSIIPSMVAHACFNFVGVLIMLGNTSNASASTDDLDSMVALLDESLGTLIAVIFIVLIIFIPLLLLIMRWIRSEYLKFNVGDQLIIMQDSNEVVAVEDDRIIVLKNEERKAIRFEKLKTLKYEVKKTNISYEKVPTIVKVVFGAAITLYGFMNFLTIWSYKSM